MLEAIEARKNLALSHDQVADAAYDAIPAFLNLAKENRWRLECERPDRRQNKLMHQRIMRDASFWSFGYADNWKLERRRNPIDANAKPSDCGTCDSCLFNKAVEKTT